MSMRERERQLGEASRLRKLAEKTKNSALAARVNVLASAYETDLGEQKPPISKRQEAE
jgi:hypothetical protein